MSFQDPSLIGENEELFGFEGLNGISNGRNQDSHDYYPSYSSSFPREALPEFNSTFPHSFAGNPSPLSFHNMQAPLSYSYQSSAQQPFENQFLSNAYFGDTERLALQMGAQLSTNGIGNGNSIGNGEFKIGESATSIPGRSGLASTRPVLTMSRQASIDAINHAPGGRVGNEVRDGNDTFIRPNPPAPRRTQSTLSSSISTSSINGQSNQLKYTESVRLPQSSQPGTPRGTAPIDYSFNSLETDLDHFGRTQEEDFALAAAAAISSISSKSRRTTANNSPIGSFDVASPRVSSDPTFAALPTRSSGPSNATSPRDGFASSKPSSTHVPSPNSFKPPSPEDFLNNSPSPSFIDEEDASSRDPVSAQAWRMVNKAKNTLPGGARLENLTWRLMSMTLKKRRAESAAAEAEAAALAAAVPPPVAVVVKVEEEEVKKGAAVNSRAEVVDRGRRGRTPTSNDVSANASPEEEENKDGMDWRAKSQSRSRSRAPEASMDWRAQSRSRSRAPIFRAPVPLAPLASYDTASAQHISSRFFGDRGGVPITPAEELANFDLAASLGLATSGSTFTSAPNPFNSFQNSDNSTGAGANYQGIEDTLSLLISQQALVGDSKPASSWTMAPNQVPAGKPLKKTSFTSSGIPSFVEEEETDYSFLPETTRPITLDNNQLQRLLDANSASASLSTSPHSPHVGSPHSFNNSRFGFGNGSVPGSSLRSIPISTEVPPHLMAHLESLAVSTPSANFVNPPSAYFNSLPDDSNNLYKYLNSITDAYPSSYSNTTNFEQTHIDPSHLSNSPFSLYSGENSNGWSYNPNLPNNNNGFNEASSPESKTYRNSTQARTNGNSLPKQRGVPVRTLSTDSNSLGEGNGITSQPVSRNHSRGNTASSGGSGNIAPVPKVVSTSGTGEEGEVRCLNCNTTNTPLWRRDAEGKPLCNACGLFRNLHGIDRPAALNTGVIKKRNRARGVKTDGTKAKAERGGVRNARRNSLVTTPAARIGAEPYPHQRPHPESSQSVES